MKYLYIYNILEIFGKSTQLCICETICNFCKCKHINIVMSCNSCTCVGRFILPNDINKLCQIELERGNE